MQNPSLSKSTHSQKAKSKSRISKRQRHRRRNKQKLLVNNQNKASSAPHSHFFSRSGAQTQNGADIWRKAYENAVRWHGEHQSSFWRHAAESLQRENQMLRQQLTSNRVAKPKQDFYETSGSDEEAEKKEAFPIKEEETEEENGGIDVQYLEFLQITFKHREEMRLKRQAEELEVDIPPEPPAKLS